MIARGSAALAAGGRFVVLDLKLPDAPLPDWLVRALLPIVRPFAVTDAVIARRPWETIRFRHARPVGRAPWADYFLGVVFLATGSQADAGSAAPNNAAATGHRREPEPGQGPP